MGSIIPIKGFSAYYSGQWAEPPGAAVGIQISVFIEFLAKWPLHTIPTSLCDR
jgi:hypothetical protein